MRGHRGHEAITRVGKGWIGNPVNFFPHSSFLLDSTSGRNPVSLATHHVLPRPGVQRQFISHDENHQTRKAVSQSGPLPFYPLESVKFCAQDTFDLFSTLIVSLTLGPHKQFFRNFTHSFTT